MSIVALKSSEIFLRIQKTMCKCPGQALKMCFNIHTEPLGTDWNIYWFQVFKEISTQSLTEQKLQCHA